MSNHFALGMTKATELTKAGKLVEATALIKSLLTPGLPVTAIALDDTVIEGEFTRLDEARPAEGAQSRPAPTAPTAPKPSRKRASLRETLKNIPAGGMPGRSSFAGVEAKLPEGAKFVTKNHANGHGQRDYKLYIPATHPTSPMPLVVMLHGCTQTPDDFAVGTGMNALAEQQGFLVAYPAQPAAANANKCWNWFNPEDQARGHGEPALIAGIVRDILRDHPVDPARVYVAGLSAGGAAAAIMAAAYPDLFSAVGVHSGLAVGAAAGIPQAFSAMRSGATGEALAVAVPTIVFHGLADSTVHPGNGNAVIDQTIRALGRLPARTKKGVSSGGKAYRQTSYGKADGPSMVEHWEIEGAGHAWSGGHPEGSYTDPAGPQASEEMLRFFRQHTRK